MQQWPNTREQKQTQKDNLAPVNMENDGPLKWDTKWKTFPVKTYVKDLCGSYFLMKATKVQVLGAWFKNRVVIISPVAKTCKLMHVPLPKGTCFKTCVLSCPVTNLLQNINGRMRVWIWNMFMSFTLVLVFFSPHTLLIRNNKTSCNQSHKANSCNHFLRSLER